jgi:hypothetical protein
VRYHRASHPELDARTFADSFLRRKDFMNVVTYGGARVPATADAERVHAGPRKRFFVQFMDALRETRLREARRVIEKHPDLLQPTNPDARTKDKDNTMKRYLIERDIQNVGSLNRGQLKGVTATSNNALAELSGKVQWLQSFIAGDKTFCIYLAESEDLIREHSRLSGIPATKITEVPTVISPMTAYD